MSQSRGSPEGREEFEPINGVVLPNEEVGDMRLTFFVDMKREVIFVILEGGMESAYFHYKEALVYIENIDMIGVELDVYTKAIESVCNMVKDEDEADPLPPTPHIRDHLLTRARVERSTSTN